MIGGPIIRGGGGLKGWLPRFMLIGVAMPDGMPFALEAGPIAIASALTVVLGLLGATIAVVRIVRVDPLSALGGQR